MLPYNPEEAVSGTERIEVEPGVYPFFVEKAEEKIWDGQTTTNLTLKVNVGDREITCFDTMYYTSKSLYRIAKFAECCGIDKPTEHEHYEGAAGLANFDKNDKGYLKVKWYEERKDGDEIKTHQKAPTPEVEELPF